MKIDNNLKVYSPKEALAFFIVSGSNENENNIDVLLEKLEQVINSNDKKILEKVNVSELEKIINYWRLSLNQIKAYAFIIFKNLIFENKRFSQTSITDMFTYVMRLYSPDNAEEFYRREYKK